MEERASYSDIIATWLEEHNKRIPIDTKVRVSTYAYLFKNLVLQAGLDLAGLKGKKKHIIDTSIWPHGRAKDFSKKKLKDWKEMAGSDFDSAIFVVQTADWWPYKKPVELIAHTAEEYKVSKAKELAIIDTAGLKIKESPIVLENPITDDTRKNLPYIDVEFDTELMERLGVTVGFDE